MQYRRLGRSGLQVSELSVGSWITYHNQVDTAAARELLAAAKDAGVNFFDNAEAYAKGMSEVVMGDALRALEWPRLSYIVSTKFYWGLDRDAQPVNHRDTLNRKYLMQAIDGSLKRMGLDFIDLVYCHRPDPQTPIEETVWAMSDMIRQGKALYWGTSEWSAADIRAAWDIAERHHLHKPVMEQPQYNLFHRRRVEQEYARLYDDIGLGLTTWSPLAGGLLSGKYRGGVPPGSRAALGGMGAFVKDLTDAAKNAAVLQIEPIAAELGCTLSQLAIAWAARNPRISTVITGASRLAQLKENLAAAELLARLTPAVVEQIEATTAPLAT
ncbi:MAG: Voltage-gated potassium channel subunit beta-1 (K(+) channel subunit beta-1) (Kv-beta-1) [Burkholderiaceae bacterium]|jgi:voltage-dependent potassium channel beta subunit|nr:MAG: Voltage-gated potassium channel subunit beta-1 (K(+) channel subunit beta-1) (Kv-beta-1) [Burkholderiaceae bacterium]